MLAQPEFVFVTAGYECSGSESDRVYRAGRPILSYLFQGILHKVPSGGDFFLLSDSVYTVKCLVLYHRVPLRLHEENMICGG